MRKPFVLAALAVLLPLARLPSGIARSADCVPVQAVFYTSGNWALLAQTLAANASACAQYYVNVPPLASSKTTFRSGAAAVVRGLGPNFHALAEVNYSAWQNWVTSTGNTWYEAGQEARRRMVTAGFDMASGDTWAVNELSSAVIAGTGQARQNLLQLVGGLHDGDGSVAQVKGLVYSIGAGQTGTSLPVLKASLESWLQDGTFWAGLAQDVSGFYQEAYGDVRSYAVAGVDPATRIQYLDSYLQALQTLAAAAPPAAATAQAFLAAAFGPLANAAWAWNSAYGFTNVASDVMADYVSAETYAMREAGEANIGFAWDQSNPDGLAASDFAQQTAGILTRLAGAIHETDAGDPALACEATGCTATVVGGQSQPGWSTFATWTPTVAAFTSAPQTVPPSMPSAAVTLQLQTGGIATTLPNPTTVTVSASSTTTMLATDPGGPWSPSLTLTLPPGTNGTSFYAEDSAPGQPTLTAGVAGQVTAQPIVFAAPAAAAPAAPPPPSLAHVSGLTLGEQNGLLHLAVAVADAAGKPLPARVTVAIVSGASTFASTSGSTSLSGELAMTAGTRPQPGCYSAVVRAVSAHGFAWDRVTPPRTYCVQPSPTVTALSLDLVGSRLHASARVLGAGGRPLDAGVTLVIRRGSLLLASTFARTGSAGTVALTAERKPAPGCYAAAVETVSAPGYHWNGLAPTAAYCVKPSPAVSALTLTAIRRHPHVALRVTEQGRPLRAEVLVQVLRGRVQLASFSGRTGGDGRFRVTFAEKLTAGCYSARVRTLAAPGFTWNGAAPVARLCVTAARHPHG